MSIHVGCCGLAGMGLSSYAKMFSVTELQSTFYRLPSLETAKGWRGQVPKDFRFAVKAFQGITHPVDSPTWRRAGSQKPTHNVERYGHLKPTDENFECWRRTIDVCKVLGASFCIIQLPPSFVCNDENFKNTIAFFKSVQRPLPIGVELRHKSWDENKDRAKRMLEKIDVAHVVDPLVKPPLVEGEFYYYRLHGLGPRLYRYEYTDEDLTKLKEFVMARPKETYVMFNNLSMKNDSLRFKRMLE